jgi:Zn-dependent peptidase ImmA (M78 family)
MKDLPSSVTVCKALYRILVLPESDIPVPDRGKDEKYFGYCDTLKCIIYIASELPPMSQWATLNHELVHAVGEESGGRYFMEKHLKPGRTEEAEEDIARTWFPAYLECMGGLYS